MIRLPIKYRNDDDDYAPVDYQFVGSVAEGRQRREAEAIHQGEDKAVVRRAAVSDPRVDAYGTHARRSTVVEPDRARRMTGLVSPEIAGPRVQRIAYPEGHGARDDSQAGEASPAMNRRAEGPGAPEGYGPGAPSIINRRAEGPLEGEFDAPTAPEIPEWLKVAKQNNLPMTDRHLRPQVTPAPVRETETRAVDRLGRPVRGQGEAKRPMPPLPQTAEDYRTAGYPAELLLEQEKRDAEQEMDRYGHKRHGAQRAMVVAEERNQPVQRSRRQAVVPQEGAARPSPVQGQPAMNSQGGIDRGDMGPLAGDGAASFGRGYAGDYEASYAPYAPMGEASEQALRPGRQPYGQESGACPPQRDFAPPYTERQRPVEAPHNPYVQEEWEDELPTEGIKREIPWLGIAAGALALVAALLWVLQITYSNRMEQALLARAQTQQAIADSHPFKYRELIETQAQINNLHPAFIAAIVLNESSFRPEAESSVGARGLMQMMPDTAEWVHGKIGEGESYNFDMMYDANINVRYACWYMNYLSEKFRGDPVLVAAAFHAGQGTVQNWLNDSRYSVDSQTIALEDMMDGPTKSYAERVLKAYAAYKRLYYENVGV